MYVYCSNPDIKEFIPEGVTFLKRSSSLDQDTTSITQVLAGFTKEVEADVYVMTHTTAPFISEKSIEKGLDAVLTGEYDSAFAAKNCKISYGKTVNHLIMNWTIFLEHRICRLYTKKLVDFIFIIAM